MSTLSDMLASGKAYDAPGKEFALHSGIGPNAAQKITELGRKALKTSVVELILFKPPVV